MSDQTAPPNLTTDVFPSICFVIPYFGRWPFWIPFFLESCRTNPTIDWLFFSDCGRPDDCPPNVKVIDVTYSDYCEYTSSRLGVQFAPAHPAGAARRLKPALGFVLKRTNRLRLLGIRRHRCRIRRFAKTLYERTIGFKGPFFFTRRRVVCMTLNALRSVYVHLRLR